MLTVEEPGAGGFATIAFAQGKVNALRLDVVRDLEAALGAIERDDAARGVILTASGPFFSFGFDVPHFLGHTRRDFGRFLHAFTELYTRLFLFPKPVIAALNGHAVAGGWLLAQPCDARVLARGNVKVGLNEVRFGATLFAGGMAILRHLAGGALADRIAGSGAFLDPEETLAAGLVDELCDRAEVAAQAQALAGERYGAITQPAFAVTRALVREPVVAAYREREADSIERFMDVWYTDDVQASLAKIAIRD